MNAQTGKTEILLLQLAKQKWQILSRFFTYEQTNMPKYKTQKKEGKTMDLHQTK